jgi:hypothetical protein
MKFKSLFVAVLLMGGVLIAPAQASDEKWEIPQLVSFSFSPKEIELTSLNPSVRVELKVSHPIGIKSEKVLIHLRKTSASGNFDYPFNATRIDSPVMPNLKEVTFVGSITLPTSFTPGVWTLTADVIQGLAPARATGWPEVSGFTSPGFRIFPDAENALLVRLNGNLDFDFQTFVGPTYASDTKASDSKPISLAPSTPIWRVNEFFDPLKYFEMRTDRIKLEVSTTSPAVCIVENSKLKLVAAGECQYKVFTSRSKDYLSKEFYGGATVLSPRTKPELTIPVIANQTVTTFPKSISRDTVFFIGDAVNPNSITRNVCIAENSRILLYSQGTCSFTYEIAESSTRLASDVYTQTFEVIDSNKPVATPTPVATPSPTPTAKPVVKKTITCVKGTKSVKRTGTAPKCPKGYKLKR